MSILDLLAGTHVLVGGVEPDPEGGLRIYLAPRYQGRYVVAEDPAAMAEAQRAWASGAKVTMPKPAPGHVFEDRLSGTAAQRSQSEARGGAS